MFSFSSSLHFFLLHLISQLSKQDEFCSLSSLLGNRLLVTGETAPLSASSSRRHSSVIPRQPMTTVSLDASGPRPRPRSRPRTRRPSSASSSSLCTAISSGYFPRVRQLLQAGATPTEVEDGPEGRCPLILAALVRDARWSVGLARILLEYGASVAQVDVQDRNALHYACLYGRAALVPVLLAGADCDLNARDRKGNSALLCAVTSGCVTVVAAICAALRRYGLSVDQPNRQGLTPLMQAWRCNQPVRCA